MNIYSGVAASFSNDKNITPAGSGHYGYFLGVDFRLNSGDLYFMGGGRYHFTSLIPEESISFFKNSQTYNYLSARFGFGFNLLHINYDTRLRSKILGAFDLSGTAPDNMIDIPGYQRLNDSSAGVITGLGLDFGPITIDLEYQIGVINAFYQQENSKFNVTSLAVGFIF